MNLNQLRMMVLMSILITIILTGCSENNEHVDRKASDNHVKVYRDEFGVPHIFANSTDDLYKTYGYVMAQDRLFQIEMFRRANEGTVSEIFGEDYLEHDVKIRRDGYSDKEVEEMINGMGEFRET